MSLNYIPSQKRKIPELYVYYIGVFAMLDKISNFAKQKHHLVHPYDGKKTDYELLLKNIEDFYHTVENCFEKLVRVINSPANKHKKVIKFFINDKIDKTFNVEGGEPITTLIEDAVSPVDVHNVYSQRIEGDEEFIEHIVNNYSVMYEDLYTLREACMIIPYKVLCLILLFGASTKKDVEVYYDIENIIKSEVDTINIIVPLTGDDINDLNTFAYNMISEINVTGLN